MNPVACRSWVEISIPRILENFAAVRAVVGPAVEVMPVVKADAYHHGAVEVSRAVAGAGARWLAVSNVSEGVELRDAGVDARILVMAGILSQEWETVAERDLTPVVHTAGDLEAFERVACRADRVLECHLKLDTGLGRLGAGETLNGILPALDRVPHLRLDGLMTHLASAADFLRPQTEEQLERFDAIRALLAARGLSPRWVHAASSCPVAYGPRRAWHAMVRPGLSLYGYVPAPAGEPPVRQLEVKPALAWKAAVLQVKDVAEGATIGYGALFRAPRPMRIAVLAAGYADGYPHQLGNRGRVIVNGRYAALLGAVSMDLLTIDATGSPELKPGDAVTLLGQEGKARVDAADLAQAAGVIPYSILCSIAARVVKRYAALPNAI